MEFSYRARTKEGRIETDVLQAPSRKQALSDLRARGLLPLLLKEKGSKFFDPKDFLSVLFPVSLLEKITFIRNLSVMIKAGLALPRALQILSDQTEGRKLKKILTEIARDVRNGKALSESMGKYSNEFGNLYISLIQVGESGGNLDKTLDYLVGYLKRDYELLKKTKGALTYPIVVLIAMILVIILMFMFVLPKLVQTFEELNVELPFFTKVLIATVNIFASYGFFIIAGLVVIVIAIRYYSKTASGRAIFHKINLVLPIISKATKRLNLARFTLTLSSLLASGMAIVEAVKISGRAMTNHYYSNAAIEVSEKVKRGVTLSDSLNFSPKLFPPLMIQMVKVGEEAGTVEKILQELNRFYEDELDEFVKNLSSIVEPVMVMIIGVVVGFMALALITPIYNISQNI